MDGLYLLSLNNAVNICALPHTYFALYCYISLCINDLKCLVYEVRRISLKSYTIRCLFEIIEIENTQLLFVLKLILNVEAN